MADEFNRFIDYTIPDNDAYAVFDATSMKNFIKKKLNENEWFTDQNFEGSNLSNVIDIIAYSYHTLLFYLNQTSSESQFTEAQIYENMNRLIKLVGYKPTGYQTSILSFDASSTLGIGTYTIPRFSFFNINGVPYSFIEDSTFVKAVSGTEDLTLFSNTYNLYQGRYTRIDDYAALGEDNEMIEVSTKNKSIDGTSINVYVKSNNTWVEWTKVDNLFTSDFDDTVYEVRFNERENYEITFGDNINGKALEEGDIVSIYYLNSNGEEGQVSSGFLRGNLIKFSEPRIDEILGDIATNVTFITKSELQNVTFTNTFPSTNVVEKESVDDIRVNQPKSFKAQNRLISKEDFESFISNNYSGIIASVKVLSNDEFISKHIGYLNEIGISSPFKESRVLVNQFNFSNSCNFNNVYIYAVPKLEQKFSTISRFNYLTVSQKQLIINQMENFKGVSLDVIIQDPVYLEITFGIGADPKLDDTDTTFLQITSDTSSDEKFIKDSVKTILENYFKSTNFDLGQLINVTDITNSILNIDGVQSIKTINGGIEYSGVSFYLYNPVYRRGLNVVNQNFQLENFQYVYFKDIENITDKITVVFE